MIEALVITREVEDIARIHIERERTQTPHAIGHILQRISARAAHDKVGTITARDPVITIPAVNIIMAVTAIDDIVAIAGTLPRYDDVCGMMTSMGAPTDVFSLGHTAEQTRAAFTMTKDIRDKYIASRLLWDLGELDEAAASLI